MYEWRTIEEHNTTKHCPLWVALNSLHITLDNNDWLVTRDFNEIRIPSEWEGVSQFDQISASEFNLAVHGLFILDSTRGPFTWRNGLGQNHTHSKLDRA